MVLRRRLFATLEPYPVLAVPLGLVMDNEDFIFMDNWIRTVAVAIMSNTRFQRRIVEACAVINHSLTLGAIP